jgi:hypothetical protein
MILRIEGAPADLESYAAGPGGEVMRRVADNGRAAGAISHVFAGGEDEILVIDEWPDETAFQNFFASQPDIPDIIRDAGARGEPKISFYRVLDTPDRI